MTPVVFKLFATACTLSTNSKSLLSFPTWYEYLPGVIDPTTRQCSPSLSSLSDVWLVVAAIINILFRFAAVIAVVFIIYGGVQYITSQGSPERTDQARKTIISAVVGLTISITASVIIGFIAGRLT